MGPKFGIDKPAIPGPGRPPLPESVKERRALLRKRIEEISPDAIQVVGDIINDPRAENKDKLRAAEIALAHSLPKQEEVEMHDNRPSLADWSPDILKQLAAGATPAPSPNGHSGNGVPA